MYEYIHTYNLLSLNNVTCMYAFTADYLVLDNQLQCFSQEKTISPTLSPLSHLKFFV